MIQGRPSRRAWAFWSLGMASWLAAVGLQVYQRLSHPGTEIYAYWLEGGVNAPVITTLGALLLARRPRHRVTHLFVGLTVAGGVQSLAGSYAHVALLALDGAWPLGAHAAWLASVAQMVVVTSLLGLLWLFPTGALPGPAWRWPAGLVAVSLGLGVLTVAVAPGPLDSEIGRVANVFGVDGLGTVMGWLETVSLAAVPLALLGAVAAPIVRFRRSSGDERAQLKWFALAAFTAVALVVFVPSLPFDPLGTLAWTVGPLLLPVAIAVAILRYRLYEIDRVIGRTVTYAVVIGVLAGVYALLVVTLQAVLRPITAESDLVVAGSTLAVAALFGPLRRRAKRAVDRRFNRRHYDAARSVESLGRRLRDEVDFDQLTAELGTAVTTTLQPATMSLWVSQDQAR